jgi:hypothetical protein
MSAFGFLTVEPLFDPDAIQAALKQGLVSTQELQNLSTPQSVEEVFTVVGVMKKPTTSQPGTELYLVRLAGACAPRRLAYRIRSSRSAAAAGFAYPVVGRRRGEIVWRYKFVGVTDQLSRVTKKTPRVRFLKCDGEKSVAKAVTSWLTYPVEWSCPAPARAKGMDRELFKAFLLVLEQVRGAKGARPFGACRDDHSSTRSAMGFKLSQTQIDFLLNRKDKPCRKSPPSGS